MPNPHTDGSTPHAVAPLRLWPGVLAAALMVVLRIVVPVLVPEVAPYAFLGAILCALAIIVWWGFFSRAPRSERRNAVGLMVLALAATVLLSHDSLAKAGFGLMLVMFALPVVTLAFVGWAVASRRFAPQARRTSMVVTILLACSVWTLVRTAGTTSDLVGSEFHWRWTPTPEERLLASPPTAPASAPAIAPTVASAPAVVEVASAPTSLTIQWPGFRGPRRDGAIRGVRIGTDWSMSPPVALWRRAIGPGWSSFAVAGDVLYTQEQRGDDEIVASYKVATGEPVWMHRDAVRFWESNGGAGPRATPTVSNGRVYAFGATGVLNALDAARGTLVWSSNVPADIQAEVPVWGFASSPVVIDDVVIVAAAGQLVGYDLSSGTLRWAGPAHGASYSSPHLLTIDGVAQIVLVSEAGATSVAPADGTVLWEHAWKGWPMFPVVQPALTADGDILISGSGASGVRRLTVGHKPGGWTATERWTSNRLKPNFNDFVVHNGHAYGFDGIILACIDLQDGERKWKGGRYGQGQLVLLPDQDLLLVTSEEGELALVKATPDGFTELARLPVFDGKTWNHPVLIGNTLLVRNGEEMAAFRLALASR